MGGGESGFKQLTGIDQAALRHALRFVFSQGVGGRGRPRGESISSVSGRRLMHSYSVLLACHNHCE